MPFASSLLRSPWWRPVLRIAIWLAVAGYFAFAALFLTLRYAVLPQVADYRADIESALSSALHQRVSIRVLDADWQALRPRLVIHGLQLLDAQGRPALNLDEVEAVVGWSSLWHLKPYLHRLDIIAPNLTIRRDPEGHLFVAGLKVEPSKPGEDDFADWLLGQHRVVIRDAAITWHDERRQAPPLSLSHVNFHLQNDGSRHRFGLTADPPPELAARLDLRGDFAGDDLSSLDDWRGQGFAEMDYTDLAAWRRWVDYPIELARGRGALRLWLNFAGQHLVGGTADVALAGVQMQLAASVPALDLAHLTGRLSGQWQNGHLAFSVRQLDLAMADGLRLEPADFSLEFQDFDGATAKGGSFSASAVDLGKVAKLAAYLPFDRAWRERLAARGPEGKLSQWQGRWQSDDRGGLARYSVSGRFTGLGLQPVGDVPGFSNISGSVDANEKGGKLELAASQAALHLPAVFPEPNLLLAELTAQSNWTVKDGQLEVRLTKASFHNGDANGEASGTYRAREGQLGEIDLSATLAKANGAAVWRYMPRVVGKDTRDWLKASITQGTAHDATLRLKGDLNRFPFRDGSGIFQVRARVQGARLAYAAGWPVINDIDGDLDFTGPGMTINARSGKIFGVGLANVKAVIADLDQPLLNINGIARGATADFLRYIEESPVGDRIDHFTEDMTAVGNGELNLRLGLPLMAMGKSQVAGIYRFDGNRLVVDADLPPLTDVRGQISFTGDALEAKNIRALLLGQPLTVSVQTANDGAVQVTAGGDLSIAGMRKESAHPLLDHLSGSARWQGSVKVRRKTAELRLMTDLRGIASSLPEPFNKSAGEAREFRLERKPVPGRRKGEVRDQLDLNLGAVVRAQFQRHREGADMTVDRGLVAIGETKAAVPAEGVALAVNLGRFDLDFWRAMVPKGGGGLSNGVPLPNQFDIRTGRFTIFGKTFNDLQLTGSRPGKVLRADVKARELAGRVEWTGEGAGRFSGRLSRVVIPNSTAAPQGGAATAEPEQLPGLDLQVDRFFLGERDLGTVKLNADNRAGTWIAKFDVSNDDAVLTGEGRWRPDPTAPDTRLDFKLHAKSIERLFTRMGYPDAVRGGKADVNGDLSWNGAPFAFDYPSLSGHLKLDANDGQFKQLEPGGLGRLIGVLSLQSLPRRITLDFNDIFSKGFAFDSVQADAKVAQGVLQTDSMEIRGPSAKIQMAGSVSLSQETQDLKVRVQPAVSEVAATAVVLAHPAVGAATWLLNKLFGSPIDRAFVVDYSVTGTWADPKVERLTAASGKALEKGQ